MLDKHITSIVYQVNVVVWTSITANGDNYE